MVMVQVTWTTVNVTNELLLKITFVGHTVYIPGKINVQ